jgi:undecaprenyl-diphosphatase
VRTAPKLRLRHAIALGLLHGPTELLPISSSAHTTLLPWLAHQPYGELDPELRKSFEVALHAGAATALLLRPPWRDRALCGGACEASASETTASEATTRGSGALPPRQVSTRLGFLACAIAPPAFAGYTLDGPIERRLGTPATIAGGLLAGSVAMGVAEMRAKKGRPTRTRGARLFATPTHRPSHVDSRDGIALGIAQSLALFPGVSRSGATIAAARARGFSRRDADRLSWEVGLPVIAGAAALRGAQLAHGGIPREPALPLAAGAVSALFSTLASARALTPEARARLLPACILYRGMLALLVIRRMRDKPAGTPSIPKK